MNIDKQTISEAIDKMVSQPAIKFKSFVCYQCGQGFIFDLKSEVNEHFMRCEQHKNYEENKITKSL